MTWIDAMWQPMSFPPGRVLVAGCGTGNEAFALRHRFPKAEIVAVDFSHKSIAMARRLQRRFPRLSDIRFLTGDLTNEDFPKLVRDDFDFVTCHGVLSYISQPQRALKNLANCLVPDGALYLGANGASHFSTNWRQALPEFGFETKQLPEDDRLRQVLNLCEALTGVALNLIAKQGAEYLAGDLFGPLIQSWPLAKWTALGRGAGLHFCGSWGAQRNLRRVLNENLEEILLPRSRPQAHELAEQLAPSSFHWLVFTRRPVFHPPWLTREKLLRCRIIETKLYSRGWPRRRRAWKSLRQVELKSPASNTLVELRVPEWLIEILRETDGRHTILSRLHAVPLHIPLSDLVRELYRLYLLALINLCPRQKGQEAVG